jgi:hypothetical protein
MLDERRVARIPASAPPVLLVAIDTEETFDWSAAFDRNATDTSAIQEIWRVQTVFDEFGIRPTYIVDYPIAAQPDSAGVLKEIAESGRAVIGAHLHAWVNPPFEEPVTTLNSYQGRLDPELERRKLTVLTETIAERMGARPVVHKAGRYGFGPATAGILADLGYAVDLSAASAFDLSGDGGPDYSRFSADPYWFGPGHALLGLPTTGAFVGYLAAAGARLHGWAGSRWGRRLHLGGILSRLGAVQRLRLSPEGFTVAENRRLTEWLLGNGVRVLSFTFHSPSVKPGCTPYVRDDRQRQQFVDDCRRYFEYFFGAVGGVSMTPLELKKYLLEQGV